MERSRAAAGRCGGVDQVAIIIPLLNEAESLPRLLRSLAALDPAPAEILVLDGGSTDGSIEILQGADIRMIPCTGTGRARPINAGVAAVTAPIVCILHADTLLPPDAVAVMRAVLANPKTALAGFTPLIRGAARVRWGTTLHNWAKTWYAPLVFRPVKFICGLRLLFGDHAMFFRRADFLDVGGCDPRLAVMEDADLCIRLHRKGHVRLVPRLITTSDRRIAAWGAVRANWTYLRIGVAWGLGQRHDLGRRYPPIR